VGETRREEGVNMSIQFQIEETPDYLSVRVTGEGTADEVWRQYDSIAEHCNRANKNKLLVNYTEAYEELSLWDRYFLGERAQIFAYQRIKVAAVLRPDQLDPKRFGEMVAQNRGVNYRAFPNTEDALEWLLKE